MSDNNNYDGNGDNDDDVRLDRTKRSDPLRAPQPPAGMTEKKASPAARLELAPPTEAPHRSNRIVDLKLDPEINRLELAPDIAPDDPPALAMGNRPAERTQQTQ